MTFKARSCIIAIVYLFLVFLTFKRLVSVDIGVSVRIPHLIIGLVLMFIWFLSLLKYKVVIHSHLYLLSTAILLISVINSSLQSPHLYFLIVILLTNAAIFELIWRYDVNSAELGRILTIATLPHILLSYLTLYKSWYGGYQLESFSDFSTFFAMQLSIIFPFIVFLKNKYSRFLVYILFVVTLLLLGSRGAIVALIISYGFCYFKHFKLRYLLYIAALLVLLIIFNPKLIDFYVSKLNPFSGTYHSMSDLNRWAYIVATLNYAPGLFHNLVGNGIKYNKEVIAQYFNHNIFDFTALDNATVHNVFLEFYSDYGFIGTTCLILFILYTAKLLLKNKQPDIVPYWVSFITFMINYNLEPNYVSYFFWFILIMYYYVGRHFYCERYYALKESLVTGTPQINAVPSPPGLCVLRDRT